MKTGAVLLLLVLNGFIVCDLFVLAPQESILFRPQVRERISRYIPALRSVLLPGSTDELPAQVVQRPVVEDEFVPPQLASLEELTQNWQSVPSSAFPRVVTLFQDATFTMNVGSTKLPAGSQVAALSFDKGLLTLAPTSESTARASLPLASTDFATQIEKSYDSWRIHSTEAARRRWENRKAIRQQAAAMDSFTDSAGKPLPDASGAYPLLLASISAGQVTEVTAKNITRWHTPVLRDLEGSPTWCVDVDFRATVFCGELDATARAHIRNGKVIAWVYPGSGEPVP